MLLGSLAFVACSPPPTPPEPPHFLWSVDAQSLENPFPDERLLGTGGLRPKWYQPFLPPKAISARSVSYFNKVGAQFIANVEGTGAFGSTLLPVSEALDPDTLQGCVARLVANGAGGWAVLERDVKVEHLRDTLAVRGVALPDGYPEFIATRPTVPMPEGAEGLLVVLKGPKTKSGVAFGRGTAWTTAHPDFAQAAAALELNPDDVILTLPQHAPLITTGPRHLAEWSDAHPPGVTVPPHAVVADENNGTRPAGKWTPSDSDWSQLSVWLEKWPFARPASHVGQVLVGELDARDLRETEYVKPEWVADPSAARAVPLRFVMSLPKGPKPAGGWPMVMGQHGVNSRNTPRFNSADAYCLEWAEPLAARGLGCIGIDAPDHGSRGNFTNFFSVDDLPALRDRFREMTFDLLQVEAALKTFDVDGDGQGGDFEPRVRYFGNSMGAIVGAGFVPVSNRVSTAVLNVPGAGLSNVVMSRFLQDLIGLLIVGQTDIAFDSPEYLAAFPLFRAVSQPLFDPGDPINVGASVKPEVAVLLQAGLGDKVIPYGTSADLAGTMRLSDPAVGNRHVFQRADASKYLPAAQAADYNGHNVIWDFAPVREQALTFLQSDGATLMLP